MRSCRSGRAAWRFVQAIYGGAPMGGQIHSLKKGASVIVATPGRLLDIIEQGHCDLSGIEVCVIDEADRMADLGFMPDVRRILDMTPSTRQTMLWSATLDGAVNELVRDYLKDPAMHDLVGEVHNGPVEHRFVVQPAMQRLDATVELLETHGPTIMFVKTRFGVDDVTAALMNSGVRAGSLHGARTQQARSRTLEDFKRGKVQVLVATDVAARGIHVDNVELVVHYDLPDNDKDYQHRSGRTGRAGQPGTVVAFVPPSRKRVAQRLADSLEHEVVWSDGARPNVRTDRPAIEADVRDSREDRPRGNRSFERPGYGDRSGAPRGDRPSYGDRPAYGDRPQRPSRLRRAFRRPSSRRPPGGLRRSSGTRRSSGLRRPQPQRPPRLRRALRRTPRRPPGLRRPLRRTARRSSRAPATVRPTATATAAIALPTALPVATVRPMPPIARRTTVTTARAATVRHTASAPVHRAARVRRRRAAVRPARPAAPAEHRDTGRPADPLIR